ncbi:MAG TPA: carboxyl transferase domain-containing protein [Acidimicrobiales bacterium]|nr:carboxyl transferase domain-containing protein [Acidimicrobiales bacterium]
MDGPIALAARVPGSVRATAGESGGRGRVMFRVDPSHHAGALSEAAGRKIAGAAALALKLRRPLLGVVASSGADVFEGVAALHGWGTAARAVAACSGIVPVALAVTGPAVSGPALLLGLADLVSMTGDAFAYLSGPDAVASWTGVELTPRTLGGAPVHARMTGLCSFLAEDEAGAVDALEHALAYLPDHTDDEPPEWPHDDDPDRPTPELRELLPVSPNGTYDVRSLIAAVVDHGELCELRSRWAPNIVTAFATIDGRPVGLVANQPQAVAGTLDIEASQKAAGFVGLCDAYNLPIVTIVDTPGFFPGKDLEWRGMIRHGAQLAFAYAEATVPRVCLITRKSYGGAFIVMDCKTMGNDVCFAWPSAEIAVMGAKGAIAILHRRAEAELQARLEAEYAEDYLTPYVAAERGYVDEVIDPAETRSQIARALQQLGSKRERIVGRPHANGPL